MNNFDDLLKNLVHLNAPQLRRLLTELLTKQKLGLYWESNAIERDAALNANIVLPRLVEESSHNLNDLTRDAARFKSVNHDGSVGDVVDFHNLTRLRQWMRDTIPNT